MNHNKAFKAVYTFFITLIFLIYVLPFQIFAFGPSDEQFYKGIDISGYQGDIDFAKVKQDGIEIVYMKSSEGFDYIDSKFERNYWVAKENGLKIGFYHFVTARTEEEAKRQAQFFASVISGKIADCKLAMDFEVFGNLTKNEINSIGLVFLRTLQELTKKEVVVYSNASTANNIWNGEITNYPLWIAQYDVREPQNNGTWKSWIGWQYTDVGEISGINTYVDRNRFTKNILLSDTSEIPKIEKPNKNESSSNTKKITIKRGDTLSKLAIKYDTTVEELVRLNSIENSNLIYSGSTLTVPTKEIENQNTEIYVVQRGDTLSQIAQKFNTTVQSIATENNIKNENLIYPGQRLEVRSDCRYDAGHRIYTVKRGDTLWSIARRYNTSIANLVRQNRIKNPNLIYQGQIFRI